MKSVLLLIFTLISYNALSAPTETLSFKEPALEAKRVLRLSPLKTNLVSLSSGLPKQRGTAALKEAALKKEIDSLITPIWVDTLRSKLKSSSGQQRL